MVLSACVTARYVGNRSYIPDPQPERPARYDALADRIDPNVAAAPDLAALPTLGGKRAADIISFREQYTATHPGARAFTRPEDLMKIDGIGPAMVEGLLPHLSFPTSRPGG